MRLYERTRFTKRGAVPYFRGIFTIIHPRCNPDDANSVLINYFKENDISVITLKRKIILSPLILIKIESDHKPMTTRSSLTYVYKVKINL